MKKSLIALAILACAGVAVAAQSPPVSNSSIPAAQLTNQYLPGGGSGDITGMKTVNGGGSTNDITSLAHGGGSGGITSANGGGSSCLTAVSPASLGTATMAAWPPPATRWSFVST